MFDNKDLEIERLKTENDDLKDTVESLGEMFNGNITPELLLKGFINLQQEKNMKATNIYSDYKMIHELLIRGANEFDKIKFFLDNYKESISRYEIKDIAIMENIEDNRIFNKLLRDIGRNDLIRYNYGVSIR